MNDRPRRLLPLLKHPHTAKVVLGLYVVCVVALIGTSMAVSNRDVRRAAFFQTTEVLESGRGNAMRGAFLDAQTGQFLPVRDVRVELFDGQQPVDGADVATGHLLGTGSVGAAGVLHLELTPPAELEAGDYSLLISATYPDGERFSASGPVVVSHPGSGLSSRERPMPDWPSISLRDEPVEHPRPVVEAVEGDEAVEGEEKREAQIALAVYPPDGELVRGLSNVVYLRTTDPKTGAPLPSRIRFEKVQGIMEGELPPEVVTNRLGLARVVWTPITDTRWTVKVSAAGSAEGQDEAKEEILVRWRTVPAQFSIDLAEPIARPGERVRARVESLYQSGGFYVDLYDDARWLDSAAFGLSPRGGGLEIDVPEGRDGPIFYRLQVYQNLYAPSRAWDVAYVVRVDERTNTGLREAAERMVGFLGHHADDPYYRHLKEEGILGFAGTAELGRAIEAFALAVPRRFEPPLIVINTQQGDREALEVWKRRVKRDLMILTVLLFLAGLVALSYFVILGVKSQRREALLIAEVDLEMDDEDEESVVILRQRAIALERLVVVFQAGLVLTTIVAFGLGILMLLSYL